MVSSFFGSLAVVGVVVGIIGRSGRFPIMQLFKDCLELFRDGQAEVRCVFQHGHAFVGKVEAYHGPAQRAAGAYPTSRKINTLRQMPLKPTALDNFRSLIAHMMPVT